MTASASIARPFSLALLALTLVTCDPQRVVAEPADELPALPANEHLATQGFEPSVRRYVLEVHREALAVPDDDRIVGRLGMVLQAYGRLELAETCFRRAAALNAHSFQWLYYRANLQGWLGQLEEAIGTLHQALALEPHSVPARLRLAQLFFDTGRVQQSEKLYRELVPHAKGLATVHFGMGQVHAAQQEWKPAIASYKRALEIAENYAAARYALAMACRRTGDVAEARQQLRFYEQAKERPQPAEDHLLEIVESLSAGGSDHFAKASRLLEQRRLRDAAPEFEAALRANPRLLLAHTNLIAIYGDLGLHKQSEAHFEAAIQLAPGSVEAYANRAAALVRQGDPESAIQALRKALDTNPFYADAHYQLGSLLEQKHDAREAARQYYLALENNPNHRPAAYSLGRSYVQRGRFVEGIRYLRLAARVTDHETPGVLQTLGIAYQYAGDVQEARSCLTEAKRLATSFGLTSLAQEIQRNLAALPTTPTKQ